MDRRSRGGWIGEEKSVDRKGEKRRVDRRGGSIGKERRGEEGG